MCEGILTCFPLIYIHHNMNMAVHILHCIRSGALYINTS